MPTWLRDSRLLLHAPLFIAIWLLLSRLNVMVEPLMSYYLALAAMYATAMFGMVILVGLSGQVSLGNGTVCQFRLVTAKTYPPTAISAPLPSDT